MAWWPWMQHWCSFVRPQVLERVRTEHHPLLLVVEVDGRRQLDGRSVNHSRGGLADVLARAFESIELERVDTLLMLGFGAGSAVELLRTRRRFDPRVTAVEIDPAVIALARRWFGYRRDERIEFVAADAAAWVQGARAEHDLVVVDAFVEDRIPEALRGETFAAAVARCVAPGGWLVFNCMDDSPRRRADADEVEHALRRALDGVRRLDVHTNRVLAWRRARDR